MLPSVLLPALFAGITLASWLALYMATIPLSVALLLATGTLACALMGCRRLRRFDGSQLVFRGGAWALHHVDGSRQALELRPGPVTAHRFMVLGYVDRQAGKRIDLLLFAHCCDRDGWRRLRRALFADLRHRELAAE